MKTRLNILGSILGSPLFWGMFATAMSVDGGGCAVKPINLQFLFHIPFDSPLLSLILYDIPILGPLPIPNTVPYRSPPTPKPQPLTPKP